MSTNYHVYLGSYLKCSPAGGKKGLETFIDAIHERLASVPTEYMDNETRRNDYYIPNVEYRRDSKYRTHFDPVVIVEPVRMSASNEDACFYAAFDEEFEMLSKLYEHVSILWGLVIYGY